MPKKQGMLDRVVPVTLALLAASAMLVVLGICNAIMDWDLFGPVIEKVLYSVFASCLALAAFGVAMVSVLSSREIIRDFRAYVLLRSGEPPAPAPSGSLAGGLLWLAVFFAGMQAVDHSCAAEREEGCWDGLLLYPIGPAAIYLAKLAVNVLALAALECLLIPVFAALADVPLMANPGPMLLVAILGNVGMCAVGTLLSGLVAGARHNGSLLVLVVLPLVIPVVLAAAEATRLAAEGQIGPEWWRWVRLLAAFAAVFVTAGATLFDFVIRD